MRLAARKDTNHSQIVAELRNVPGVDVFIHNDAPWDISVGFRGRNWAYEIKKDKKAKLTDAQNNFHKRWAGHWKRVESVDEILADLGFVHNYTKGCPDCEGIKNI